MSDSTAERTDLTSVEAKLGRADEHLVALAGEITTFANLDDHNLLIKGNEDATEYVGRIKLGTTPDFERWALIFGDFAHCLRAALDHLVYAISVAESGADPPPNATKVMFPIKRSEQGFSDASYRIASLSSTIRTRIESLQPYPGLDNYLLGVLEDTDIRDKHRVLTLGLFRTIGSALELHGIAEGTKASISHATDPLEDDAPLVTLTFDRPSPNVKVKGGVAALVVIREAGDSPRGWYEALALAKALRAETRRAIDLLLGQTPDPTMIPPLITSGGVLTVREMTDAEIQASAADASTENDHV